MFCKSKMFRTKLGSLFNLYLYYNVHVQLFSLNMNYDGKSNGQLTSVNQTRRWDVPMAKPIQSLTGLDVLYRDPNGTGTYHSSPYIPTVAPKSTCFVHCHCLFDIFLQSGFLTMFINFPTSWTDIKIQAVLNRSFGSMFKQNIQSWSWHLIRQQQPGETTTFSGAALSSLRRSRFCADLSGEAPLRGLRSESGGHGLLLGDLAASKTWKVELI